MKLQLDILRIENIQFAEQTTISDRILSINRRELQEFLRNDKRLKDIEIELAHPGEPCRIIQVLDVIEPRFKKAGGVDFPGALERQGAVGEGRTCVLKGTAVVMSEYRKPEDPPMEPSMPLHGGIIDMSGLGANLSIYGKTHNVVLVPRPANAVSLHDYRIALKVAGLKTAAYLAKAGTDIDPDETEVYDLPPPFKIGKAFENLPRVAYIFQIISGQFESIPGYPILYGGPAERIAPTILHPNEILDGAIITPYRTMAMDMYGVQNHSLIKELYRLHGKELCFTGVVISVAHDNERENERAAIMAANLVKWVLGAEGVILTKSGGGIPEVAMALIAQRCEEIGIKTSLALAHYAADLSDAVFDGSILFNRPEIDAVVTLGAPWAPIVLPPVERIIGKPLEMPGGPPANGKLETKVRWVKGVLSQIGNSRLVAVRY